MSLISKQYLLFFSAWVFTVLAGCTNTDTEHDFVGYIETDWVYISAPQSGWIINSTVEEGSDVIVGQPLFKFDSDKQHAELDEAKGRALQAGAQLSDIESGARPTELKVLQAQLEQAQAGFSRAKLEHDRTVPLLAKGTVAAIRGDQVKANYKAAKAAVSAAREAISVAKMGGRDQVKAAAAAVYQSAQAAQAKAQWQFDQRQIRSLVNGRVEEIFYRPGEFVIAGSPLVALQSSGGLKVRFFVPQAALTELDKGQPIKIFADSGESGRAIISYIASNAEFTPPVIYSGSSRNKLVFMVEASLGDDARFHPGLPVDIDLK